MKRIARFEKVSYEQFESAWADAFGKSENIKEIYDNIKLPKRATSGSAGYDFYIPDMNILIECQGLQHIYPVEYFGGEEQFKVQQEHDRRKREYAEKNGYKLLEISYWNYDKIDEILSKELSVQ